MTVYIVCNAEVYASRESALALVRKLIETGAKTHWQKRDTKRYRSIMALLREDVELALDYWNANAPDPGGGTGDRIEFREAEVRE